MPTVMKVYEVVKVKLVFLSNYFNHHQRPLSNALYSLLGGEYVFIETKTMNEERRKLGWAFQEYPKYVITNDEFENRKGDIQKLIDSADVVIIGSAPDELLKNRKKSNRLIFRYSERALKKGTEILKYFPRYIKWRIKGVDGKNIYMLCASSYTAADYSKFRLFKGKCYKWGYFPQIQKYDNFECLIESKKPASILWVARLIGLKHPECAIEVAKYLKAKGYSFELNIIGNGVLEEQLKSTIEKEKLHDCVHMLGAMSPEKVREQMGLSEIFLFTSDRNEGWGAVLNESMNSACAVVASHAIGSVPFLVSDKQNGLIYQDGNINDLCEKTKWLLDHPKEQKQIGKNAYLTISDEWNAETAAKKIIALSESILNGEKAPKLYENGVCSEAEILADDWYQNG